MKNKTDNRIPSLPIFMCLGLSVGTAIGSATGNLSLYMSIGLSVGVCVGALLDAKKRKASEDAAQTDTEKSE